MADLLLRRQQRLIHGLCSLDHSIDRESFSRPLQGGFTHSRPQLRILQQLNDAPGHGLVVANRHQESRFAIDHDFWNRPCVGRHGGFRRGHCIHEGRTHSFTGRADREQIESLRQLHGVIAEPGEKHVAFEMLVANVLFECRSQLTIADDDESRVWDLTHRNRGGVDQMMLTLVRHERRDVPDDRRLGWQVERGPHVRWLQSDNPFDVNAFVDDGDLAAWDAVGDEPVADHAAVGDEPVHLRVGPS